MVAIFSLHTLPALSAGKETIDLTRSEKIEMCKDYSKAAEMTMEDRQNGKPMAPLIELNSDNNKVLNALVIEAFETPRFQSKAKARKIVESFRDKWYLNCIKTVLE